MGDMFLLWRTPFTFCDLTYVLYGCYCCQNTFVTSRRIQHAIRCYDFSVEFRLSLDNGGVTSNGFTSLLVNGFNKGMMKIGKHFQRPCFRGNIFSAFKCPRSSREACRIRTSFTG